MGSDGMSSEFSTLARGERLATTISTHPTEELAKWRQNPERLAWVVLLGSFLVFVVLAVTLPLTARYIMRYATVGQQARLEPTLGTLLLYPSPSADAVAVTSVKEGIGEGSTIVAAEASTQGSLAFMDSEDEGTVLGSVQLYAGTTLDVERIRRPFFTSSPEPYHVRLYLEKGQARIFSNSADERPLRVELETPHGVIELDAGSYQVSVNEEQTDITVRSGRALLSHQEDGNIAINANQSAWMTVEDFAHEPLTAERNLLRNGDFSEPELDAWKAQAKAENVTPGTVMVYEREGRWVAHFSRDGKDEVNVNTEVNITQVVEKDVNIYDDLSIRLDVKLMHQSLPGAGYLSSEYPLRVEITYTDIYGKVLTWGHGFYYRDPEDGWQIVNGEKIAPYSWYTYQSPNLMEELASTRPARINSVRIYASGWNYQSMVSEVYLVAE
jgi:hypothetical protein